jgi:hypothetical protein
MLKQDFVSASDSICPSVPSLSGGPIDHQETFRTATLQAFGAIDYQVYEMPRSDV